MSAQQLQDAIRLSGYPLQVWAASYLDGYFAALKPPLTATLQEEWSYPDADSPGTQRSLDLHVSLWLWDLVGQSPTVRPNVALLVECKQFELPLVFFSSKASSRQARFPHLVGLRHDDISLQTDDDRSTYTFPLLECLDLQDHPLVSDAPFISSTLSKANRKGSGLELSGSETYNGIVLPMLKALRHFELVTRPTSIQVYFDAYAVVPLCILEAPMAAVRVEAGTPSIEMISWARLVRREQPVGGRFLFGPKVYVVDFVHKNFLAEYLDHYVVPFARAFGERVMRHDAVVAAGAGFVSGLGHAHPTSLEPLLRPLTMRRRVVQSLLDRIDRR